MKRIFWGGVAVICLTAQVLAQSEFAQWAEGSRAGNDGATAEFYNRAGLLRWQNTMGDWVDAEGITNGVVPFSRRQIVSAEVNSAVEIEATELVQAWISRSLPNDGFLLRLRSASGNLTFAARDHADPALRPVLHVRTEQSTTGLPAAADTYLVAEENTSPGDSPELLVSPEHFLLIRFDLSNYAQNEKVIAASLHLHVLEMSSVDTLVVDVFSCRVPDPGASSQQMSGLAAELGSEPELRNNPDVLLFSDFENSDWKSDWSYGMGAGTLKAISSDSKRRFKPLQGRALRVKIPRGEHTGMNAGFNFAEETGKEPEEIYFRYYLRISDAWQTSHNGKLPGISGTYNRGGWGGRPSNGENGWSARGLFRMIAPDGNPLQSRIPIGNYVYHADMPGTYGDSRVWQRGWLGFLEKNRWYCIEQYLRLNTPGENDGVLRGWIDGRLAYEETGWRWRDTEALKIEKIWMNVYHGGSARAPQDIYLYIDNVVIARTYIGPAAGLTVSVREPARAGDGDAWRLRSAPNPFRAQTLIHFTLQRPQSVKLVVYDVLGRQVRLLAEQRLPAGAHRRRWDGRNDSGVRVPPGMYFYVLHFAGRQSVMSGKVVLLP